MPRRFPEQAAAQPSSPLTGIREDADQEAARIQEPGGIMGVAVDPDLIMQMQRGAPPAIADHADLLS